MQSCSACQAPTAACLCFFARALAETSPAALSFALAPLQMAPLPALQALRGSLALTQGGGWDLGQQQQVHGILGRLEDGFRCAQIAMNQVRCLVAGFTCDSPTSQLQLFLSANSVLTALYCSALLCAVNQAVLLGDASLQGFAAAGRR